MITIGALTLRAVSDQIGRPASMAGVSDSLFELTWPPAPESARSVSSPTVVGGVHRCTRAAAGRPVRRRDPHRPGHRDPVPGTGDLAATPAEDAGEADPLPRVHALTRHVLAQLQSWLARPDTANTRLVIVTRHAVSVSAYDGVPDLAHAAAWALIHTAQNENPDRIVLLDTDDTAATEDNLLAIASAPPAGEPQLALRNGVAHIPRLARTAALTPPDAPDWQLATTRQR